MRFRVEFWSSTEGAAFQKALVRELQAVGCRAEEKYAVAQSEYWAARSRWQRFSLRMRSYALYPLRLGRHFARITPDRIGVVCSNTFYAPWVAIKSARQPRHVVHWVFDLYPDVLIAGGWRGPGESILRAIMRRTFETAAANVFLGDHLLRHAEVKFGPIPRAHVIAVGADGAPFRESEPSALVDTRKGGMLNVLYCGNLGRMHEIDTLSAALPDLVGQAWRVNFCGNGSGFVSLRQRVGTLPYLSFGPNLETSDWVPAMKSAEVALVTLKATAGGLVLPSKTYSALVAGQAVLAVCSHSSDLAELVLKHDAGWVVTPGDMSGFVAIVKHILNHPEEVLEKRRKAWRAGHKYYEQRVIAQHWHKLIKSVALGEELAGQVDSRLAGVQPTA
jgi:glycosyltransferase involved in cell wall biosynthesis